MLLGKVLYRNMCEAHHSWDTELPVEIAKQWKDWCLQLPPRFEVPRSLVPHQQPVKAITLHAFGDASKNGVSAPVYAVVEQDQATTQILVCAKARLAKQNITIPLLELVADSSSAYGGESRYKYYRNDWSRESYGSVLLAGLYSSLVLDQWSGRVSPIRDQPCEEDPRARTSDMAPCND